MGPKHSPKQHRRRRRRHTVNVSSNHEQHHQSCPANLHRSTAMDAIESPLKYIVPYIETSTRSSSLGDSCDDSVASSISSPSLTDWSTEIMIKHKKKEKKIKQQQQQQQQISPGQNSPISPRRPRRIEPIDNDDDYVLPPCPCLPDTMLSFPGTAQCNLEQRKIHSSAETKKKERRRHSICTPSLNHTPSSRWGTALERYQQESKKDMHKEEEHQKKKIDQSNKSNKSRRSKDQNSNDDISPLIHKPSIHRRRSVGDVPMKQVYFAKTSTSGTSKTMGFSSSSDNDSCSTSSSKSSDSASTFLYKQACQDVKLLNMKVPLETTTRANDLKRSLFYISTEYDDSSISSLDTSSVLSAACTENDWNLLQDARKSLGGVSMEVTRTRRHSIKE